MFVKAIFLIVPYPRNTTLGILGIGFICFCFCNNGYFFIGEMLRNLKRIS